MEIQCIIKETLEGGQAMWKEVSGYNGRYEVHSSGIVRSVPPFVETTCGKVYYKKGKVLHVHKSHKSGYFYVNLKRPDGKRHPVSLHRIVAIAFVPNLYNKPEVNHKDGDKSNNTVENLEWVTRKENYEHAVKVGLSKPLGGENKRPVHQYTKDGTYIQTFDSLKEAYNVGYETGKR